MAILAKIIHFDTLRALMALLCLLTFATILSYPIGATSVWKKRIFWFGFLGTLFALGGTMAFHLLRTPRGLAAQYYENPSWTADPSAGLDRYFYADGSGRRVERFIDFNANDFNLHTFGGKPFSAKWQGYVYIPRDGYRVTLRSNVDSQLLVDDELMSLALEGSEVLDFGKAASRKYLVKGWSFDERSSGENSIDYVWADNDDTLLLLAAVEPADYELRLRCYPFNYPGSSSQEMEVWVEETLLQRIQLKPGWEDYRLAIPRTLIESIVPGTLRVKFVFSQLTKVSDVSASNDERELAVAFDVVELQRQEGTKQFSPGVLPRPLSKGLHRLDFKARTFRNRHSFIQLVWSSEQGSDEQVIPEDYLFAEDSDRTLFLKKFRLERVLLWCLSVAIVLTMLLFAGWLFSCVLRLHIRTLWTREVLLLVLLCLFAFAVRAAFILERSFFDSAFHLITPGTDQANYVAFARGLFRGYWPGLTHAPFHFNVLNAFYLALNFVLFGENLLITRLVTAGMSVITILFTYFIARRVFQRQIAYLAAVLCACNGILIFYDTSLLISPLKTF